MSFDCVSLLFVSVFVSSADLHCPVFTRLSRPVAEPRGGTQSHVADASSAAKASSDLLQQASAAAANVTTCPWARLHTESRVQRINRKLRM